MAKKTPSPVTLQVNTHDRSQIEISVDYHPRLASTLEADFYFFLPKNFGIHSASYPRDQFYNDLINHLRFHTPITSSPTFTTEVNNQSESLKRILGNRATAQERELLKPIAIQDTKLFANRVNTALKRIHKEGSSKQNQSQIQAPLTQLYESILKFRSNYVARTSTPTLRVPSEVRLALLQSDEFVSNRIIATCSDLLHQGKIKDDILLREKSYRISQGEHFVDVGHNEREREHFYFRHSLLKKAVAQPLHIEKVSSKQERIYRNWVAGCGAGLAGLWAQIADYQSRRFQGHPDFGLSMLGVGIIAILVYIFKDRLKDMSKEYINDKMKLFLPDYRSTLVFNEIDQNGKWNQITIGKLSEYVKFNSTKKISEDILFIRKLKKRKDIRTETQETVIQYHKSIRIDSKTRVFSHQDELCDIKDIHRFNFGSFLTHLDDPKKQISIYDEDEGAAKISAPKVYHVNIVTHIRMDKRSLYNHIRVVLDKEGIVRMETILPLLQT